MTPISPVHSATTPPRAWGTEMRFDARNPMTWFDDLIPEGWEWRVVDVETGEHHLFDSTGIDVSEALWNESEGY